MAFEHRDQMVKFAAHVEQFLKDKRPDYDSLRIEVKGKEIFCDSAGHSLPFAYDIVLHGEVD